MEKCSEFRLKFKCVGGVRGHHIGQQLINLYALSSCHNCLTVSAMRAGEISSGLQKKGNAKKTLLFFRVITKSINHGKKKQS